MQLTSYTGTSLSQSFVGLTSLLPNDNPPQPQCLRMVLQSCPPPPSIQQPGVDVSMPGLCRAVAVEDKEEEEDSEGTDSDGDAYFQDFDEEMTDLPDSDCLDCFTVARLLESVKCLPVDVRGYAAYSESHIRSAVPLSFSKIILKRLGRGNLKVIDTIAQDAREGFERAQQESIVLLYDRNSGQTTSKGNTLATLLTCLKRECAKVYYIDGGFLEFSRQYPELLASEPQQQHARIPRSLSFPAPIPTADLPSKEPNSLAHPVSHIFGHVFIGCKTDASDASLLKNLDATHILNITQDCPNFHEQDPAFNYLRVPLNDSWHQGISEHFERCFDFIDHAAQNNHKVLIHCTAGISRSATVAIAYVMRSSGQCFNDVYAMVKRKRSIISPNLDFIGSLLEFDRKLRLDRGEDLSSIESSPLSFDSDSEESGVSRKRANSKHVHFAELTDDLVQSPRSVSPASPCLVQAQYV